MIIQAINSSFKNIIMKTIYKLASIVLASGLISGCETYVDNEKSRHNFVVGIEGSAESVVLNEEAVDDIALDIKWNPATDYGDEYIVTYEYKVSVEGSKADALSEYEDMGIFERSYTNGELQDMIINRFGMLTSSWCTMKFVITATFDGPTLIVPDESTVSVRVKTYGAKQFGADELYMDGTAVGEKVRIEASETNPSLYVWTGKLAVGTIRFPVVYGDENNVIIPAGLKDTELSETPMPATVEGEDKAAGSWLIPTEEDYRVTVNMDTRTVSIIPASSILEIDKVLMSGTAVADPEAELSQALENESVYAFKGELKAGTLHFPILFGEEINLAFVPVEGNDINDGQTSNFKQVAAGVATGANLCWNIPADGIYRIVLDTDAKTITFRSAATDIKNKEVSFNKTYSNDGTPAQNPYTMEVTKLYMYGTFNNYGTDSGMFTGFQEKFSLQQSLANPYVFVYKGAVLPRNTAKDDNNKNVSTKTVTASVNFKVTYYNYNVYCYSSKADAKRNDHSGYVEAALGQPLEMTEGQADNRYAFFIIPENCNYIEVNIETMKVTFDNR